MVFLTSRKAIVDTSTAANPLVEEEEFGETYSVVVISQYTDMDIYEGGREEKHETKQGMTRIGKLLLAYSLFFPLGATVVTTKIKNAQVRASIVGLNGRLPRGIYSVEVWDRKYTLLKDHKDHLHLQDEKGDVLIHTDAVGNLIGEHSLSSWSPINLHARFRIERAMADAVEKESQKK